ncbi:MAG: ATP-binding protein [Chthoniobacteraceae bacterium]
MPFAQPLEPTSPQPGAAHEGHAWESLARVASHVGIFEWDIPGKRVILDSTRTTIFGLEAAVPEYSLADWIGHFVPEDRLLLDTVIPAWMDSAREEEQWAYRFIRPDGAIRWICGRGLIFRDAGGKPMRVIGTHLDITEFQRTEQDVERQKADFENIFNLLPAQIWYKDAQNRIVRVNDKVCRDIGLSREAIEGHPTEEFFPRFAEAYFKDDLEVITSGRPKLGIEEQINAANGDLLWIQTNKVPVKDAEGNVVGVLAISNDLTERKRTEEYLRQESERSKVLLELYDKAKGLTENELYEFALDRAVELTGSEIGFLHIVSEDQKTIELKTWNRAALKACTVVSDSHYSIEKAGNWADCVRTQKPLVYNDYPHSPHQKGIPSGHAPIRRFMSVPVIDHDKVRLIFGVGNKATEYDDKDIIHMQLVANELQKITQKRRADEALKQAKEAAEAANSAKDQFLAVLSHELRTPLTPVLASVSALQTQEGLPAELRDDMDLIRRNVEMESKLIDDLLDVTKISRGKIELHLEVVDICTLVRNALEICQKGIDAKHLEIVTSFQAKLHHALADPTRMRQVFWNLIKNAVEFTPDGGRITLNMRNEGDRLRVEISDTGAGIRPELLPKIFNAFERGDQTKTRRFGGLGLGLNIVKTVVELHHGTVTAFSAGPGTGAAFTVDLPALAPPRKPLAAPAPAATRERPRKILLVDDHPDTLSTLAKLLRRWGYEVVTADCVHGALETAAREPFDVLISDLGLTDGSGLEIMRGLRHSDHLRGIAYSGYGTEEDIRKSREAGFEDHLVKPVSFDALRAAVQRITSAAPASASVSGA